MALKWRTFAAAAMLLLGLAAVESQASEAEASVIADRLSAFIRIPTVSHQNVSQLDAAAFERAVHFLQLTYPRVFEELQLKRFGDYSLLLHWRGSDPDLKPGLFMAHYDVVPAEHDAIDTWQYPPFSGTINDGFVYGRGALDNKNGVIAWMEALDHLLARKMQPARSLYFAIGHDEETGGRQGAAKMAAHLKEQGIKLAFTMDEGGGLIAGSPMMKSNRELALIGVAEKGYASFTLSVKGEGGHASMPVVDPAVQRLARAVVRIGNRPMPQRIIPSIRKMLSVLAQDQGAMQRFAMKNLWLSKSVMLSRFEKDRLMNAYTRSTRAVTILSAGVKDNSVPKLASATVNMRLLPGDSDATALRYLRDTVNDSRVDITLDAYSPPPPESAVDTPFYTLLAEAAEDHYPGVLVAPALLVASTDSKHFSDISDVVYRFSPVLMTSDAAQTIHGSNERVGVAAMHGLVKVNISILERAAVAF